MTGLLVRGGEVVDGTGAPARRHDVRIAGGVIAEIGPGLARTRARTRRRRGPGDAWLHRQPHACRPLAWWDTSCDPMPQHGVTTVLMGNCSLSLAPVRAADRRRGHQPVLLHRGSCRVGVRQCDSLGVGDVAGVPGPRRTAGMQRERGGYVGHTPLRLFVMGQQAWERPATEIERRRWPMCSIGAWPRVRWAVDIAGVRRGPRQAADAQRAR